MTAPPTVSRRRAWICNISAIIILGSVGALFWMMIDRDPPFVRMNGAIMPAQPKPEEWMTATWETLPLRKDCRPVGPRALTRTIIDGAGQIIDIDPVDALYDGQGPIVRSFKLPRGATPGPARYRSSACFACGHNLLHHVWPICVDKPEIRFEIGESDEGKP